MVFPRSVGMPLLRWRHGRCRDLSTLKSASCATASPNVDRKVRPVNWHGLISRCPTVVVAGNGATRPDDASYHALAAACSVIKRLFSNGRFLGDQRYWADFADFRDELAKQRDPVDTRRTLEGYKRRATADEVAVIERALLVLDAGMLAYVTGLEPRKGRTKAEEQIV